MKPKPVGLILFERIAADELSGPSQAFFQARIATSDDREFRCYQVLTLGIGTTRCLTESGVIVKPPARCQRRAATRHHHRSRRLWDSRSEIEQEGREVAKSTSPSYQAHGRPR